MTGKFQYNLKPSSRILEPELTTPVNYNKLKPLFSMEYLDKDYCISKCVKNEKSSFADTLRIIGQMTWDELYLAPRHGNGCEKIKIEEIHGRKPKIITPDVDYVLAIRFHGKMPMVGHKVNQVFYIIWVDRKFDLYKH
jgi:hypothetical protein